MEENPEDSKNVNKRMKEESVEMVMKNRAFFLPNKKWIRPNNEETISHNMF